jgi:hypothetical protein
MRVVTLLDNQLATVQGQWIATDRWLTKVLNIQALIGAASIRICVSARDSQPLNTEDETALTPDYVVGDINKPIQLGAAWYPWMKANKIAGGAGTGNTRVYLIVPDGDDSIA